MAGTVKIDNVALGDSATPTHNFVLKTNGDGTATLARGNVGATTQDILTVDAAGKVTMDQGQVYVPAGTGAVEGTVEGKLRESVSVLDFGADPTGVADSATAIQAAMTAVNVAGGGRVNVSAGTFKLGSALTIPANVILTGQGKGVTVLKRAFTGDLITSVGARAGIEYLTIDGDTATQGTGRGVLITGASTPSIFMLLAEVKNFVLACLEFTVADAGSTFRAMGCDFYTTGTPGTVAAIKMTGTDTAATSRHFYNCESGGCTLYDFGGSNDTYVSGGYTRDFKTSANTSKLLVNNLRVGNVGALTIAGSSLRIENCVFADVVTLTCTNSHFNCEVPGYAITDSGTGNDVFQKSVSFTSTWTASGTAPALGNGSITATYSRAGNLIDVLWDVYLGSTSTVGSGTWYFSLPRADYSFLTQMCGSGFCSNGASSAWATFVVRVEPGSQKVSMYYVDTAGIAQNVAAAKPAATWGAGSSLRLSCRYYTT